VTSQTESNLALAFAAESKAAARNAAFAQKAEQDGYAPIARLFRAVAEAESVHARRYLRLMRGKIGSTEDNLKTAFENEIKANVEEYPGLIRAAAGEGQEAVVTVFSQSRDVESRHAELYKRALADLLSEKAAVYYVCQVCGYVGEDRAPEKCPVCGAVAAKFRRVD